MVPGTRQTLGITGLAERRGFAPERGDGIRSLEKTRASAHVGTRERVQGSARGVDTRASAGECSQWDMRASAGAHSANSRASARVGTRERVQGR